ncbi:butyrophilin-like protein 2 [Acipenser oxyrinchus oxyrinchus]|uniref:Butyrophilin-like protein 2 n=1 Tax=Acipenser oxyrinchus oxyrinchus TaxID=40147 RepID=A0AAD8CPS0_ACIOX|nr:butyrophilin-like protein 2 [Acipenser oxyrinchus oxyrinchus]
MKMRFLGRTCLIVLSLLPAVSTQRGRWTVVGSDQPVIAEPGDDVILPCHISPRVNAVDMEVRWYREIFNTPVHLYMNQNDQLGRQDRAYQDRTALSPPALERGDISLHLRNLRPSDRGVYTCLADDGSWNEEGQTEVIVAALGTQPSISMDSTQGEQTRLVCRSEGWSPEPEVIWRDRDGNDVTSLSSTAVLSDSQWLLSVSSYIKIKQQSNVFSCLVRSKTPKPDWESKLHISSEYHMFVD